MSPAIIAVIKAIILPPGIIIIIATVLVIYFRKSTKMMIIVFVITFSSLYLLSTTLISRHLASIIETEEILDFAQTSNAQAIVVLGCNLYVNAPEYEGFDDVSACSLIRLRYAAEVYEQTNLPVMTCGGSVFGKSEPEAEIMANVFKNRFNIETTWVENTSTNTFYNAMRASEILHAEKIDTVILVTHAIHMRRSRYSFEKNGINVIPAPTYFRSISDNSPVFLGLLPRVSALHVSRDAIHEMIGFIWHVVKEN